MVVVYEVIVKIIYTMLLLCMLIFSSCNYISLDKTQANNNGNSNYNNNQENSINNMPNQNVINSENRTFVGGSENGNLLPDDLTRDYE